MPTTVAEPNLLDVRFLQDAFRECGEPAQMIAMRLGWRIRRKGGWRWDGDRVLRRLGLREASKGQGYGRGRSRKVRYDTAVELCEAMGYDPVDLGL